MTRVKDSHYGDFLSYSSRVTLLMNGLLITFDIVYDNVKLVSNIGPHVAENALIGSSTSSTILAQTTNRGVFTCLKKHQIVDLTPQIEDLQSPFRLYRHSRTCTTIGLPRLNFLTSIITTSVSLFSEIQRGCPSCAFCSICLVFDRIRQESVYHHINPSCIISLRSMVKSNVCRITYSSQIISWFNGARGY